MTAEPFGARPPADGREFSEAAPARRKMAAQLRSPAADFDRSRSLGPWSVLLSPLVAWRLPVDVARLS